MGSPAPPTCCKARRLCAGAERRHVQPRGAVHLHRHERGGDDEAGGAEDAGRGAAPLGVGPGLQVCLPAWGSPCSALVQQQGRAGGGAQMTPHCADLPGSGALCAPARPDMCGSGTAATHHLRPRSGPCVVANSCHRPAPSGGTEQRRLPMGALRASCGHMSRCACCGRLYDRVFPRMPPSCLLLRAPTWRPSVSGLLHGWIDEAPCIPPCNPLAHPSAQV